MKIPSSEDGENMLCTEIVFDIQNNFCTQHVLPMFFKKKSFWQRFTCTRVSNNSDTFWTKLKSLVHSAPPLSAAARHYHRGVGFHDKQVQFHEDSIHLLLEVLGFQITWRHFEHIFWTKLKSLFHSAPPLNAAARHYRRSVGFHDVHT